MAKFLEKLRRKNIFWLFLLFIGFDLIYLCFYLMPVIQKQQGVAEFLLKLTNYLPLIFIVISIIGLIAVDLSRKFEFPGFPKLRKYKRYVPVITLAAYFLFFTLLAFKRDQNLLTGTFDYGLQRQLLWNISQGRWFASSLEVNNYLGDHFSILALIPGLLFRIFSHPLFLFAFQTLMVTLAAAAIYKIFLVLNKSKTVAYVFTVIFCFYMGVSGLLLADIHIEVMALPLLCWGLYFYFISEKREKTGLVLLLLAILAKEDIGIAVGSIGLAGILIKKDRKAAVLLLGFVFSILEILVLIPAVRGAPSDTLTRYALWGNSGTEIIVSILIHPFAVIGHLLQPLQLTYLVRLLFPLAFLPLLGGKRFLIVIPSLLINLLTNYEGQLSALNQYDIATTAVLFFVAAYGFKNLQILLQKRKQWKNVAVSLMTILIFFNLLLIPGHLLWKYIFVKLDNYDDYLYLQQLSTKIPENAILVATDKPGAQLAEHEHLFTYNPLLSRLRGEPDFVVIDKLRDAQELVTKPVSYYMGKTNYRIFEQTDHFLVLKKD
jgi:uncharacterized membrane protein